MNEFLTATGEYIRHVSAVEGGALIFGIGYVLLAARDKMLCWPVGIVGSILAMAIAAKSNYRLDVLKESYYVLMGFYGWYAWVSGARTAAAMGAKATGDSGRSARSLLTGPTRPIVSYSALRIVFLVLGGGALSIGIGYGFSRIGSSLPYLDASTTVFSFLTTWLVTQKVLENWLFWIIINAVSFYMYAVNGFYAFSTLMLVYLIVSVFGYFHWRTEYLIAKH